MNKKAFWTCAISIVVLAALARWISLPTEGFFCDVPIQIQVVHTGDMVIQFPGYAPFHYCALAITKVTGCSVLNALVAISFACGMGLVILIMQTARELAGDKAALISGLISAVGVFPVYFSVVGSSYPTDMLAIAGMLYHGVRFLRNGGCGHFYGAIVWFCFGCLMRPLSMAFAVFGIAWLLWKRPRWDLGLVAVIAIAATAALYVGISLPHYHSLYEFLHGYVAVQNSVTEGNLKSAVTNLFRVGAYPMYFLNVWLVFAIIVGARAWRALNWTVILYVLGLTGAYFLFLVKYIPHAGYYCFLFPALVVLPWLFAHGENHELEWISIWVGTACAVIGIAQLLLARPIAVRGMASAAADAYFLQYSRAGIKASSFDTLSTILYHNKLFIDEIPKDRVRHALESGGDRTNFSETIPVAPQRP